MLAQYTTPTVTGEGAVSWDKGAHCVIPSVEIMGKCVQDGTPTPDAPIEPVFSAGTTMKLCGSNLADIPDIETTEYAVDMKPYLQWYIDLPVGTNITVSADCYVGTTGGGTRGWAIVFNDGSATDWLFVFPKTAELERISFQFTKKKMFSLSDVARSNLYMADGTTSHVVKNITVNIGDKDLGYTPYFDGGTAAFNGQLLSIPKAGIADTYNPVTGIITKRAQKMVMDGGDGHKFTDTAFYTDSVFLVKTYNVVGRSTGYPEAATNGDCGLSELMARSVVCNFFESAPNLSSYQSKPVCTRGRDQYSGLFAFFPYEMFGVEKGITNDEALVLANNWLAERAAEGNPLWYAYVMRTPEFITVDPIQLIQPHGTGSIIQTGGTVDSCPITVKCVAHS